MRDEKPVRLGSGRHSTAAGRSANPSKTMTALQMAAAEAMISAGKIPEAPVLRCLSDPDLTEIIRYYGGVIPLGE